MTDSAPAHSAYRHTLLVHDTDEELIAGTRAFVARGLASGAEVMVHGTRERVALMQEVLDRHPRLTYGFDEELYRDPTRTVFGYQRSLAERTEPTQVWVTGTVPLGHDEASQSAWHRYEAVVDPVLGAYPFVAMCTYDSRTRPTPTIAAALSTHRLVTVDLVERDNPLYVEPAAFLGGPLARLPRAPTGRPSAVMVVLGVEDLPAARGLLTPGDPASPSTSILERLRIAMDEVIWNGLRHGRPPVRVTVWAEDRSLTCLVEDSGLGHLDPLTGFAAPRGLEGMGLWAARQLVDDLVIGTSPSGGCSVLLAVHDQG